MPARGGGLRRAPVPQAREVPRTHAGDHAVRAGRRQDALAAAAAALLLAAATFALHARTAGFGYVFDDRSFILGNPGLAKGLSADGLRWALSTFHHDNWHPLTWIAHLADRALLGPGPGTAHLVNAALHALCAALLFLALRRLTGAAGRSALAAALFASHPLRVESVAWVTERKDALSGVFWALALLAWARYARRPGSGRYALAALAVAGALLAKPMAVTLPLALLLADWWPLGRMGARPRAGRLLALALEKAPLLALAAGTAWLTWLAQRGAGAVEGLAMLPLAARIGNALLSCADYLRDTLWPAGLAAFYPHPGAGIPAAPVLGAGLLLAALAALALRLAPRTPALLAGWLWFLGTLVPVLGIVQVGAQARADRFTYVPAIGLAVAAAWGGARLARGAAARRALPAAAAALALLAAAAWRQAGFWRDERTLFARAAAVTQGNWLAENGLGLALAESGDHATAEGHYRASLRMRPNCPAANNLGLALLAQERAAEAAAHYRGYLGLCGGDADFRYDLGLALAALGRAAEAEREYRAALAADPGHAGALMNLGVILADRGEPAAATGLYRLALRTRPDWADLRMNLGNALADAGEYAEALAHHDAAARLAPGDAMVRANRGVTYAQMGRRGEALAEYREALRLDPGNAVARRGLATAGGAPR